MYMIKLLFKYYSRLYFLMKIQKCEIKSDLNSIELCVSFWL